MKITMRTTIVVCVVSCLVGQTTFLISTRASRHSVTKALPLAVCDASPPAAPATTSKPRVRISNDSPEKLELAFQNVEFDLRSVEQIKAKHAFEEGRLAEDAVEENFKRKLGSEERGRQIEYVKVPGKYIAVKMPGQCAFRNRYAVDVDDYTEYVATLVNLCKAKMKRTFHVDTKGSYTMEHFRNHIRERIEGLAGFGGEKSSAMVMLVLALNASALCSGSYLDLLDECKDAAQNDKPMSLFKDTIGDQVKSNMKRLEKENSRLRKESEELK